LSKILFSFYFPVKENKKQKSFKIPLPIISFLFFCQGSYFLLLFVKDSLLFFPSFCIWKIFTQGIFLRVALPGYPCQGILTGAFDKQALINK